MCAIKPVWGQIAPRGTKQILYPVQKQKNNSSHKQIGSGESSSKLGIDDMFTRASNARCNGNADNLSEEDLAIISQLHLLMLMDILQQLDLFRYLDFYHENLFSVAPHNSTSPAPKSTRPNKLAPDSS
jgi:hypothetical protein